MVSARKKRQSIRTRNRRLLSQLDDFDQDNVFGDIARDRQQKTKTNENTGDQEFTDDNILAAILQPMRIW